MANAESLERAKREQPQPQQQGSQWPTQSQEHVYEFEGAYSPTRSMESNTYAEVGPFGAVVRAKSYTVMCLGYLSYYSDTGVITPKCMWCSFNRYHYEFDLSRALKKV